MVAGSSCNFAFYRMSKLLSVLIAFAFSWPALAQGVNVARAVATVADLVGQPPETFASSPNFGGPAPIIYVETSGDTVAGTGKKKWWYSAGATFPTNTAAENGPLAYPYGAATGRWLYVPEAGFAGATLASAGVPGTIPGFATTNSIGTTGISTNVLRNISRVFPLVSDMLAESPTNWAANSGGPLIWLETTGDSVIGANPRRWKWEGASSLPTNTLAKGGPIAWPYGASAGRYAQVSWAGMYAPTDRVMIIPTTGMDNADSTMSATDPQITHQEIYDAASAAYDPVLGRVTVDHPWGTYTGSELLIRGKVRYRWNYEWRWKKRSEASGLSNRSIATTVRKGFANQDPVDGSFLSWGTSGTNDFSNPDHWYGNADGVEFCGTGKAIFDQNQKGLVQPALRLLEVRDFVLQTPGLLEVWLSAATNAGSGNSYGIQPCGRNIILHGPIVRGGTLYAQDGIHIGWGEFIKVDNAYVQSGDDAFACQAEAAGGFTLPPDEPLRHVRISNSQVYSKLGRAVTIHHGNNQINAPYLHRTPSLIDIVADGISGIAGETHSTGLTIGNWPDGGSIQDYTIVDGGSGYTNGYWSVPVTATIAGSGAWATIKVEAGVITRCFPAKGGSGTGFVSVGSYSIGATNIAIGGGSGYVFAGDKIKFTGDASVYTVNSVSNNAAITLTAGLAANLGSGVALAIQSSTPLWKTGTGYRQDEAPVTTGFIPGGSGAAITANVYGQSNSNVVDCGIQNFQLEVGGPVHDGVEPYGIRIHGITRGWLKHGNLSITENTTTTNHRPFVILSCKGFKIEDVRISPTTWGGQVAQDIFPKCSIDDLVFDDFEAGPINRAGNGVFKFNGTNGSVSIINSKIHIGTNGPGLYIPDQESSRGCYIGRLELEKNTFDSTFTSGTRQAVDLVPNLGTGPFIGHLRSVGNTFTNIGTWDSTTYVQMIPSFEIHGNTGGMRTELQIQITQNSGATNAAVPISTYTGLIDGTPASLPQIVGIVPVDYLGAWRLRANTATSATLETAAAASSNSLWNVNIYTGRKPIGTGY